MSISIIIRLLIFFSILETDILKIFFNNKTKLAQQFFSEIDSIESLRQSETPRLKSVASTKFTRNFFHVDITQYAESFCWLVSLLERLYDHRTIGSCAGCIGKIYTHTDGQTDGRAVNEAALLKHISIKCHYMAARWLCEGVVCSHRWRIMMVLILQHQKTVHGSRIGP